MIAIKKDAMRYRDPETGKFVGVSLIGGDAPSGGTPVEIDDTLTQSGKAADAKAVGDRLSALNEANATQDERLSTLEQASGVEGVIARNVEAVNLIRAAKKMYNDTEGGGTYGSYSKNDLFAVAHISDLHTDPVRYENFLKFVAGNPYINAAVITGDMIDAPSTAQFADMLAVETHGVEPIKVVGNHERYFSGTTMSNEDIYANWGLTTGTGLTYYYVDYASNRIRIIVLNAYDTTASDSKAGAVEHFSQDQIDWFVETLQDASSKGYAVMVCMHSTEYGMPKTNNKAFFQRWNQWEPMFSNVCSGTPIEDIVNAYQNGANLSQTYTFSDTGESITVDASFSTAGSFVAYMNGHHHVDNIGYSKRYPNQLYLSVACGVCVSNYRNGNWDAVTDLIRLAGTKTEDVFNVYVIDTTHKKVKVIRVGSDVNDLLEERKCEVYDYTSVDVDFEQIPATSITLSASTLTFDSFDPQTLTVTVEPSNTTDTVVWSTSASNVATVSGGVVTPVGNGTATITATAGSVSASCTVSVNVETGSDESNETVLITNYVGDGVNHVTVVAEDVNWSNGDYIEISVDATESNIDNDRIPRVGDINIGENLWTSIGDARRSFMYVTRSSGTANAQFPRNGNNVKTYFTFADNMIIRYTARGITVNGEYLAKTDSLYTDFLEWMLTQTSFLIGLHKGTVLTVNYVKVVHDTPPTGISLSNTELVFSDSAPQTLTATLEPSDSATLIVWKSSDFDVATVADGVVTPVGNGTATITATAGSVSASCTVTVDGVEDKAVIPDGYERIEYLSSEFENVFSSSNQSKTPYIITDFPYEEIDVFDHTIECTFDVVNYSDENVVFGGRNGISRSATSKGIVMYAKNASVELHYTNAVANTAPVISSDAITFIPSGKHRIALNQGRVYLDGEEAYAFAGTSAVLSPDYKFILFGRNNGGSYTSFMSGKIYSFIVRAADGSYVARYLPVKRVADGVCGMYNAVTGAFFESAGTNAFNLLEP